MKWYDSALYVCVNPVFYTEGHPYTSILKSPQHVNASGWRRKRAETGKSSWFSTTVVASMFAVNVCKYTRNKYWFLFANNNYINNKCKCIVIVFTLTKYNHINLTLIE